MRQSAFGFVADLWRCVFRARLLWRLIRVDGRSKSPMILEVVAAAKTRRTARQRIPPSPFNSARRAANRRRFSISIFGLLRPLPRVLDLCCNLAILDLPHLLPVGCPPV